MTLLLVALVVGLLVIGVFGALAYLSAWVFLSVWSLEEEEEKSYARGQK